MPRGRFCERRATYKRHSLGEQPVIKPRPVYLNLTQIRLPLPGFVSILHRISGAALFIVGIPLALYALQESLGSPEAFARLSIFFVHPLAKLVLIGLIWAYLHHFCAGIRFLLLDLDQGIQLKQARQSSVVVLVASLAMTLIIGARLW
jgi:succinate dehydrogenase / fumarate reductase, cytochrome b subunit